MSHNALTYFPPSVSSSTIRDERRSGVNYGFLPLPTPDLPPAPHLSALWYQHCSLHPWKDTTHPSLTEETIDTNIQWERSNVLGYHNTWTNIPTAQQLFPILPKKVILRFTSDKSNLVQSYCTHQHTNRFYLYLHSINSYFEIAFLFIFSVYFHFSFSIFFSIIFIWCCFSIFLFSFICISILV